jgi:hypothetical protein
MASTQKDLNPTEEQVLEEQALIPPLVVSPRLYILRDQGNHEFIYETAGPTLWYGPQGTPTQYTSTTLNSPLGSLVTFILPFPSPIPPGKPFPLITRIVTLVLPGVNMGNTPIQPIKTIAIFTTGGLLPFSVGQNQFCTVVDLQGDAYA